MQSLSLISQTLDANGKVVQPVTLDEVKKHLRVDYADEDDFITDAIDAAVEKARIETNREFITAMWQLTDDHWPIPGVGVYGFGWGPAWGLGMGYPAVWPGWPVGGYGWQHFIDIPKPPLQFSSAALSGATHGTTTVDGLASTTGLKVGMFVTSLAGTDFAVNTTIAAIVDAHTITLSQAALSSLAAVSFAASTIGITYVDPNGTLTAWDASLYQVDAPQGPLCNRGRIAPVYGEVWPLTRLQMDAITITFPAGYGDTADAVPAALKRAIKLMIGDIFEDREDTLVATTRATVQSLGQAGRLLQQFRSRPRTHQG